VLRLLVSRISRVPERCLLSLTIRKKRSIASRLLEKMLDPKVNLKKLNDSVLGLGWLGMGRSELCGSMAFGCTDPQTARPSMQWTVLRQAGCGRCKGGPDCFEGGERVILG
jgi:hypothetical protein